MGKNFDKIKDGYIDFLLLDDKGYPFIVLEAKSEDRDPLVGKEQARNYARKNFQNYLVPDYRTIIFKENRDDWRKAEIVVSTVQTLMFNNKYKKYFKPTDFSLLIVDESHRSINGNSRAVFEYFLGYKLGLTATPRDYLKNVDENKLKATDPRAWEKRQLLDSYKTFGTTAFR